jgi:hypothetical protein
LTARKNIVAMLVPRKQTRQNETGKTILHIRQRRLASGAALINFHVLNPDVCDPPAEEQSRIV